MNAKLKWWPRTIWRGRLEVELVGGDEVAVPYDETLASGSSWRGGAVPSTRTTTFPAPAKEPRLTSLSLYSWSSPPNVGMDHNADQRKDREGPPQDDTRNQRKFSEERTRNPHRKDRLPQVSQELGDKLQFILTHGLHAFSIARSLLLSNLEFNGDVRILRR